MPGDRYSSCGRGDDDDLSRGRIASRLDDGREARRGRFAGRWGDSAVVTQLDDGEAGEVKP